MAQSKTINRFLDGESVIKDDGFNSREQGVLGITAVDIPPNTVMGQVTATKQWLPLNLGAGDGTEVAAGILYTGRRASAATQRCVVSVRRTTHNGKMLIWPAGITAPQKAAALTQLAGTDGNKVLVR